MYELRAVTKRYTRGKETIDALDGVDLSIADGDRLVIQGPTGGGKSTLLQMLGGLDRPTSGEVVLDGTDLAKLSEAKLTRVRSENIGFVFQSFNLIPTLNAEENILLPLAIAGRKADPAWFDTVIQTVGLRDRLSHRPNELSGGQQQRVACARALVSKPEIVFADEPTGNLDSTSGAEVLGFLRRSVDEFGQTIVMVTHDPVAAAHTDRVVFLADGRVVDEMREPTADKILERMKRLDVRIQPDPAGA